jgi:N-acetylglucosamine kinase-like BadF-type ATPase
MILIADGGSTKTEWRLIDRDKVESYSCAGINPFFNSQSQIKEELNNLAFVEDDLKITELYFYGAGLTAGKAQDEMESAFRSVFKETRLYFKDDLTAAARALFSDGSGIVCILGTGSNSGLYKEGKLVEKVPALGYILGDEGSGADIGKSFLNALLKRRLPGSLTKELIEKEDLEMNTVLHKVYKEKRPNRYMASLTQIMKKHMEISEIRQIVLDAFDSFVNKNILKYPNHSEIEVGFVGSIAWHFQNELKEVLSRRDLRINKIIQQPIENLVLYHKKKINNRN